MSSHHIIREDQEPALLIDGAQAENIESIQQLLEWSPTVIVTEQAIEQVLMLGIKVDLAVAVESHAEELRNLLRDQFPVKVLSCSEEIEILDTALYYLTTSKQKAVNIISDAELESFEKFQSLDISVIQEGKRWVFIRNGHFEKWLPAGTLILTFPENAHPESAIQQEGMVTIKRDHSFWVCEIN